jgi:mannosylfructose-phosphate synthase
MKKKKDIPIKSIAMLSTHGYFDPVPQLGRTDTGGQVVYVLKLAEALSKLDIKVDIYTRWFNPSLPQVDPVPKNPGVRIIRIKAGPWEFLPKETIYDVLPELSKNMAAFVRKNKLEYDLYHGHYVDAGIVTIALAKEMGKPAFFTAHSLGAWKKEEMGGDPKKMEEKFNFKLRIKEEMRIFKSVNAQSVTTRLQQEKLDKLYGFKADNITVIPPGTDIHRFRPLKPGEKKQKTGLPDKYIFCLSRIDTNKGHDFLLKAFAKVVPKVPDIHLVIGGGSPQPQAREREVVAMMEKITRKRNLQDKVLIIGYVPDEFMVPYYRQAEIFALPSLFEPFGMTSTEAMACGVPVIASKFGGIKNVISSGKNGILADPSDPDKFAKAIIELIKNKDKAQTLGHNGYETIKNHYSWEAIAQKYINFYRKFRYL